MKSQMVLVESSRMRDLLESIGDEQITEDQEREIATLLAEDNGMLQAATAVFDMKLAIDRCKARENVWRDARKSFEARHDWLRGKITDLWTAVLKQTGVEKPEPFRTQYFSQSFSWGRVNVVLAPGCSMDDVDPMYTKSEECEHCGGTGRVVKIDKAAQEEFEAGRKVAGLAKVQNPYIVQRATPAGKLLQAEIEERGYLGGGA